MFGSNSLSNRCAQRPLALIFRAGKSYHRFLSPRNFVGSAYSRLLTLIRYYNCLIGRVAELVDALDLGSSVARREGSSPSLPTSFLLILSFLIAEPW